MTGFAADWLGLREPADGKARDWSLLQQAAEFASRGSGAIVDLGCGTGSTFRALDPHLTVRREWRFVDDDPRLLAEAERLAGPDAAARVSLVRMDLTQLSSEVFDGALLVTASALFDLVSSGFVNSLAGFLANRRVALYSALNVDGRILWDEPHPLDDAVRNAFAEDQRRDKGFGPALGSTSGDAMRGAFAEHGYHVETAASDWRLGLDEIPLQDAFHDGFAHVAEGSLSQTDLEGWLDHRRRAAREGAGVIVGHFDLFARPVSP